MKLNKVKETGFYKSVKDEKPDYIFEVIKNTDKKWLKDNPQATLLIDEWGYEYTDDDDRRHYETFGSLTSIQNADEIEVEKMIENFIVSGQAGNHLTEDKLTYKEKFIMLKQALEEIKKLIQIHFENSCMLESCYYKNECGENCYPKKSGKIEYCCYENAEKIEKIINEVLEQ